MIKNLEDFTIKQVKDTCDSKITCDGCPFTSICGNFVYDWIINKKVVLEDKDV